MALYADIDDENEHAEMKAFMTERGTLHRLSVRGSSPQNAIPQRVNWTLLSPVYTRLYHRS